MERERGGIDHATVRLRLAVVARASLERQPEVRIKMQRKKDGLIVFDKEVDMIHNVGKITKGLVNTKKGGEGCLSKRDEPGFKLRIYKLLELI